MSFRGTGINLKCYQDCLVIITPLLLKVGQSFDVLGCSVGLVILGTVALKDINPDIYNDETLSVEEDRGASILGRPDGEAVLGYQLSSLSWERLSCSSTLGLEEFAVGDNWRFAHCLKETFSNISRSKLKRVALAFFFSNSFACVCGFTQSVEKLCLQA